MVSLSENMIVLNGKTIPIKAYEVWFQTPRGLVTTREAAIDVCHTLNIDVEESVGPVSVATTDGDLYEII